MCSEYLRRSRFRQSQANRRCARIDGVKILGVEPDPDYNRTVITFAGTIKEVENAAILLIEKAIDEIDMRLHNGEHPRMGCVDVCPFIPISNATMDDCVEVAIRLRRKLHIQKYLSFCMVLHQLRKNVPCCLR